MRKFDRWWFPDEETQLAEAMTKTNVKIPDQDGVPRLTWQYHKYAAAVSLIPAGRRGIAVDVGAHIGLWSYWMARDFDRVIAFEPNESLHYCFVANMPPTNNVELLHIPLGAEESIGRIDYDATKTGGGRLVPSDPVPGSVIVRPLDSIVISMTIDLMKIDVEGGELAVIQGAEQTIRRCQPILILEVQQQDAPADFSAVRLLESWGATIRTRLGNDVIMEWSATGGGK